QRPATIRIRSTCRRCSAWSQLWLAWPHGTSAWCGGQRDRALTSQPGSRRRSSMAARSDKRRRCLRPRPTKAMSSTGRTKLPWCWT
ncbi:hypothetical protein GGI22_004515, partial [Coemansia erecta]